MRFGVRNIYYLRISASTVIPLYLYLDERHVEWMGERVLQHVLADLRPKILQKLIDEADAQLGPGGAANAIRGSVDVQRGDSYQFGYFLRKMEPHSVLIKTRHFVEAPDLQPAPARPVPDEPTPEPSIQRRRKRPGKKAFAARGSKRAKTKGKQRAWDEDEGDEAIAISSDEDEDVTAEPIVSTPPRRSTRARKLVVGGYREDEDHDLHVEPIPVDDDGDVEMTAPNEEPPATSEQIELVEGSPPSDLDEADLIIMDDTNETPMVEIKHEVAEPDLSRTTSPDIVMATSSAPTAPPDTDTTAAPSGVPATEPTLVPEDTDSKKKLKLQLQYQGFNIHGRCLCVIVEPYPPIRAPSRAVSLVPMGLMVPRAPSIAPPNFVPSGAAAQRERTPLFLPDHDRERSETPAPPRTLPPVPLWHESAEGEDSDGDGDGAGMLQFSQVLRSHQAITVEDDDEMEGSVFFGDADETREL